MHLVPPALLSLVIAGLPLLPAQDILYYKFESNGGSRVINYAGGSGLAPREGTIVSTNVTQWAPGAFGSGSLQGAEGPNNHNYVDSGWTGPLMGSWSMAWFMKERTPLPNTLAYYLFSGIGSFRVFTSGAAGMGLRLGGWGGADLVLSTDIRTPAQTRWVHVAVVVDATALTATWYVDGVPQAPVPVTSGANLAAGSVGFLVGMHTRLTTGSFWDLDEFRLVNRAAVAPEVMSWANVDLAAEGAFGSGCGATLVASGGQPQIGNALYMQQVGAPAGSAFSLGVGLNRLNLGGLPLPFNLGTVFPGLGGCMWESSSNVFLNGVIGSGGTGMVPLPIPNNPTLVGAVLYDQATLLIGGSLQTSNPHASAIGN